MKHSSPSTSTQISNFYIEPLKKGESLRLYLQNQGTREQKNIRVKDQVREEEDRHDGVTVLIQPIQLSKSTPEIFFTKVTLTSVTKLREENDLTLERYRAEETTRRRTLPFVKSRN